MKKIILITTLLLFIVSAGYAFNTWDASRLRMGLNTFSDLTVKDIKKVLIPIINEVDSIRNDVDYNYSSLGFEITYLQNKIDDLERQISYLETMMY